MDTFQLWTLDWCLVDAHSVRPRNKKPESDEIFDLEW